MFSAKLESLNVCTKVTPTPHPPDTQPGPDILSSPWQEDFLFPTDLLSVLHKKEQVAKH